MIYSDITGTWRSPYRLISSSIFRIVLSNMRMLTLFYSFTGAAEFVREATINVCPRLALETSRRGKEMTSRIYFNPPASGRNVAGFLSFVFNVSYSFVTSFLQLVFAMFQTNGRPGKLIGSSPPLSVHYFITRVVIKAHYLHYLESKHMPKLPTNL